LSNSRHPKGDLAWHPRERIPIWQNPVSVISSYYEKTEFASSSGLQDKGEISNELKRLLPESYQLIIKDLPAVLKRELERKDFSPDLQHRC